MLTKKNPALIRHLTLYAILGIMLASIMSSSFFIYQHIYRTLDDANALIVLNAANTDFNVIDTGGFNRAQAALLLKQFAKTTRTDIRYIFDYQNIATTTASGTAAFSATTTGGAKPLPATNTKP